MNTSPLFIISHKHTKGAHRDLFIIRGGNCLFNRGLLVFIVQVAEDEMRKHHKWGQRYVGQLVF